MTPNDGLHVTDERLIAMFENIASMQSDMAHIKEDIASIKRENRDLRAIAGRHGLISAVVAASTAGLVMTVKYIMGGRG